MNAIEKSSLIKFRNTQNEKNHSILEVAINPPINDDNMTVNNLILKITAFSDLENIEISKEKINNSWIKHVKEMLLGLKQNKYRRRNKLTQISHLIISEIVSLKYFQLDSLLSWIRD